MPVETTPLCGSAIHDMDRAGFTLVYRLSVLTSTLTVMTTCMLASRPRALLYRRKTYNNKIKENSQETENP